MKHACLVALVLALFGATDVAFAPAPAAAEESQAERDATRERLRAQLQASGPKIGVSFTQSTKNPYNFVGVLRKDLKNCDLLEIIVSVSNDQTIGFRIYPHYKSGYVNLGRVKDRGGFAQQLLRFSDDNFLFWGVDDALDTFTGYTITLESGFPAEAIDVVLQSIPNTDKFVGTLRPFIDGSSAG